MSKPHPHKIGICLSSGNKWQERNIPKLAYLLSGTTPSEEDFIRSTHESFKRPRYLAKHENARQEKRFASEMDRTIMRIELPPFHFGESLFRILLIRLITSKRHDASFGALSIGK